MRSVKARNRKGNNDKDRNGLFDRAWILPFMMLGAMFGSLIAAGFSLKVRQQAPFGPALVGAAIGIFIVGLAGWLLMNWLKPQL